MPASMCLSREFRDEVLQGLKPRFLCPIRLSLGSDLLRNEEADATLAARPQEKIPRLETAEADDGEFLQGLKPVFLRAKCRSWQPGLTPFYQAAFSRACPSTLRVEMPALPPTEKEPASRPSCRSGQAGATRLPTTYHHGSKPLGRTTGSRRSAGCLWRRPHPHKPRMGHPERQRQRRRASSCDLLRSEEPARRPSQRLGTGRRYATARLQLNHRVHRDMAEYTKARSRGERLAAGLG
jgi:hypothetical protein